MRPILTVFATAVLGLTAGTAQAQTFTGPSAGVQGGWSRTEVRNPSTDLGVVAIDSSQDTATFGGFVGYDYQVGSFVLGAQADLMFGTSDAVTGTAVGPVDVALDTKRSLNLTARAGYLVTPDTLVYLRGGYTNDRVRTTFTSGNSVVIASEDRDGWLVGGGVEKIVFLHVSARIEYRYADLSDGYGKYDRHQVLTGIAYRF